MWRSRDGVEVWMLRMAIPPDTKGQWVVFDKYGSVSVAGNSLSTTNALKVWAKKARLPISIVHRYTGYFDRREAEEIIARISRGRGSL